MGQYHKVYNIDKREFIHAHDIGNGLKLLEQCGPSSKPTTSDALWLLLANSNGRGGGDAQPNDLIGRWAGDRIVVQGDYAEDSDPAFVGECESFTNISQSVGALLTATFVD